MLAIMPTAMYGPTSTENWSRFVAGVGDPYRRALAKVRLRLEQSVAGYATAARLATTATIREFAGHRATVRAGALVRFEVATRQAGAHSMMLMDIAGRLHRRWMRLVAGNSPVVLVAEIDRGESALETAIRRALDVPPTTSLEAELITGELQSLLGEVRDARTSLRAALPTRRTAASR